MPSFGLAVAVMYYKQTQNLELMNFEALQHNVKIRQKGKRVFQLCGCMQPSHIRPSSINPSHLNHLWVYILQVNCLHGDHRRAHRLNSNRKTIDYPLKNILVFVTYCIVNLPVFKTGL